MKKIYPLKISLLLVFLALSRAYSSNGEIDSKREDGIVARRVAAAAAKDTKEYRKRFPLHSSSTRPVSVFRDTRESHAWRVCEGEDDRHEGRRGIDRGSRCRASSRGSRAPYVLTRDYKFASRLPRCICTRAKLCAYRP